jgi:hypothetical protein
MNGRKQNRTHPHFHGRTSFWHDTQESCRCCSLVSTEYRYCYEGATQMWKCTVNRVFCAQFVTLLFTCHDTVELVRRRCCDGGSRIQHMCTASPWMKYCHCCERAPLCNVCLHAAPQLITHTCSGAATLTAQVR